MRLGATAHVPVVRRARAEVADRARANREIMSSRNTSNDQRTPCGTILCVSNLLAHVEQTVTAVTCCFGFWRVTEVVGPRAVSRRARRVGCRAVATGHLYVVNLEKKEFSFIEHELTELTS